MLLCSSFWADVGSDGKTVYCGIGPDSFYDNFTRPDPSNLDCEIVKYQPDTGTKTKVNKTATCGPNKSNAHYCPKLRGNIEFTKKGKDFINLWKLQNYTCHTESSGIYCKDVIDQGKQKLMAEFFTGLLESQDDFYAQYADNDECTKKMLTSEFWSAKKVADSSFNMFSLSFIASILLIFGMMQ